LSIMDGFIRAHLALICSMEAAPSQYQFHQTIDPKLLVPLQKEWEKSLLAPQDGMWEMLRSYATQWELREGEQLIGYASVDDENRLLQFYLISEHLQNGAEILQQFIEQEGISKALIGTHNPIALSLGIHLQKEVTVDTYLFEDHLEVSPPEKEGTLRVATLPELEKMVDFYHHSMGGPKDWLNAYLGDLLGKEEVFYLEQEGEIRGVCEVRRSTNNPNIADIGMVVSPDFRQKGYGTYLLGQAKAKAIEWGRSPICSCEKGNAGSMKSIQNNGFRSFHQLLLMEF
ncbi:MAG: GNAT family N-acetyltransferase, partial [Bacteroidia bacterium]